MIAILLQKILDLLKNNLSKMPKFNITTPQNGDTLVYDSSNKEWVNGAGGGISDAVDITSGLTIDFITIEESSCNVKAYRMGNVVILEINYMKYLTTPENTGVIISGLPKAKSATYNFVYDIYNQQVGGRMRVNTDGELTQWYFRPYPNHDIVGQIIYVTDEV